MTKMSTQEAIDRAEAVADRFASDGGIVVGGTPRGQLLPGDEIVVRVSPGDWRPGVVFSRAGDHHVEVVVSLPNEGVSRWLTTPREELFVVLPNHEHDDDD